MMGNFKDITYLLIFVWIVSFDEILALKNVSNYEVNGFHCVNGKYIRSGWFCDGMNDCGDASDESYGCDPIKCGSGNFTCENSQCLDITTRCNHVKDCADGSDENFCDHEPKFDDCELRDGKFLCKDKLRCLDLSLVCDEEVDCFDGSDEDGKCDQYDPDICNVCFRGCYRTPNGPICFYNSTGEYLKTCFVDKNLCDQKCVSLNDVNQCSCEENFVPSYTLSGHSFYCEEKEKERNMFLYYVKGAIMGIPGYSNQSILIKETKENITAIAAANELVYWAGTQNGSKVIGKTSFSGKETKIIVNKGITDVAAMDVDWRTGDIYFIDNIEKKIAACTKDGKRCITIRKLNQESTSITLTPRLGEMYWTIHDDIKGFIRKSSMSGKRTMDFVVEGLRHISCLSADEASEKLYWVDTVLRRIEVIRFDQTGRKVFMSDLRSELSSIAVNARYLYWILNNNNSIYFTPGTRIQRKLALSSPDPVRLIYGYSHSEKTTKMESPCSWGCEGICLTYNRILNKTGSVCICANASEVEDDGIWCREAATSLIPFDSDYEYNIRHYFPKSSERLNHTFRTILVIVIFVVIISGVVFYLYRNGGFDNLSLHRHALL